MEFSWSLLTLKQKKTVIGVLALVVFLLIGSGLAMIFSGGSFSETREELTQLEKENSSDELVINRRIPIEKALKESISLLEEKSAYIPFAGDRYAWAYEYISRRSTKADIEVIDFRQGEAKGQDAPYEVSLATKCGYNELVRYLWYLEEGNPLILIKEMMLTASTTDHLTHNVRIVVQWPAPINIKRAK